MNAKTSTASVAGANAPMAAAQTALLSGGAGEGFDI